MKNNTLLLLSILLVIFTLCSVKRPKHLPEPKPQLQVYKPRVVRQPYVDPMLEVPVRIFLNDMRSEGIDVSYYYNLDSIILVPKNEVICDAEAALGCCFMNVVKIKLSDTEEIRDSLTYYNTVLYHELGHCVLGLPHNGNSPSLMNATRTFHEKDYTIHWKALRQEYILFYWYHKAVKESFRKHLDTVLKIK